MTCLFHIKGTGTNVMNTNLDQQCLLTKICIPTTGRILLAIYSKDGKVTIIIVTNNNFVKSDPYQVNPNHNLTIGNIMVILLL